MTKIISPVYCTITGNIILVHTMHY